MLTIQPNFRQATNRNISFKQGYYSINSAEDSNFCEKTLFYENQAKEFGQMSKDKKTPDFLKKTFKSHKSSFKQFEIFSIKKPPNLNLIFFKLNNLYIF